MKLTVLGFWGAYPEKGDATSGYLLQIDKHNILLDCGSAVLSHLFKYILIVDLDAVFLSHYHNDHFADIGCLQYACRLEKRKQPLDIYGPYRSEKFNSLTYLDYTVGHKIEPGLKLDLFGISISFLETMHEEYNLAMRFESEGKSIIYTGDTGFTEKLIPFAKDSDLLICESSLFANQKGQVKGHLTAEEVGEIAARAEVKKLLMTHFPHFGNLADLEQQAYRIYQGPIKMAFSGLTIEI